jgi:hypothetical protein
MKKLIAIIAIIFAATTSASALDLQSARATGQIGEKNDGYVTALQSTLEAKNLAAEVNEKRKAEYARISKENGQTVDVVAKIAAGQIITKLPAGAKYQDNSGAWKTK